MVLAGFFGSWKDSSVRSLHSVIWDSAVVARE